MTGTSGPRRLALAVGTSYCWLAGKRPYFHFLGSLFGAVAVVALLGNLAQIRRFEYLSFEGLADARVISTARVEHDGLYLGPTVATEYALSRDGYQLRVTVDEQVLFAHATVELVGAPEGTLLEPRAGHPQRAPAASTRFLSPCGTVATPQRLSSDATPMGSTAYTMLWIGCADSVAPGRAVLAFDVVAPAAEPVHENLPFEVKTRGFFVRGARFDGGILQWGAPIGDTTVRYGGSGFAVLLRLLFSSPVPGTTPERV